MCYPSFWLDHTQLNKQKKINFKKIHSIGEQKNKKCKYFITDAQIQYHLFQIHITKKKRDPIFEFIYKLYKASSHGIQKRKIRTTIYLWETSTQKTLIYTTSTSAHTQIHEHQSYFKNHNLRNIIVGKNKDIQDLGGKIRNKPKNNHNRFSYA